MDPKRRLVLNLRRSIRRVHRRFDVEDLGEGRVRLTCQTCGTATEIIAGSNAASVKSGASAVPKPASFQAVFLARWWTGNARNGISGNCETCLRADRDLRYPLPPKQ